MVLEAQILNRVWYTDLVVNFIGITETLWGKWNKHRKRKEKQRGAKRDKGEIWKISNFKK